MEVVRARDDLPLQAPYTTTTTTANASHGKQVEASPPPEMRGSPPSFRNINLRIVVGPVVRYATLSESIRIGCLIQMLLIMKRVLPLQGKEKTQRG